LKTHNLVEIANSCGFNQHDLLPDDSKCPVTLYRPEFVPSRLLDEARTGWFPTGIRHCLGCELCSKPPSASFPAFTDRIIPAGGMREGYIPRAFGGALDSVVSLQLQHGENQKRFDWVTDDIEISEHAGNDGVALFVGCSPYYDVLLEEKIGFNPTSEARAAVELLNAIGVKPVVLPGEVCCGGDRLHAADYDAFVALGNRNRELMKERGVTTIVTTCDDCRYTLANRYPGRIEGWDFRVVRLTDYLMENDGKLAFMPTRETVVIQPPDIYSDPAQSDSMRKLLARVPDITVMETIPGHPSTFGGWGQLDNVSKQMETALIKAAELSGAVRFLVPSTRVLVRLLEGRRPGSWEETSIRISGLYSFLASRHAVTEEFTGA